MPCSGTNCKGLPCKRPCAGDWCLSHAPADQQGDGIKSAVKKVVKAVKTVNKYRPPSGAEVAAFLGKRIATAIHRGPRTSASNRFQEFLDENEGNPVVKVQLGRKPIVGAVHKALDTISLGGFSKAAKKLNYDKVYHNFLLVTLANGKTYKVEKNEVVVEKPASKGDYANEVWDIPLKGRTDLTLKKMVETASQGNTERFYKYRADSDNCQRFTRDMVEKNGLMPDDINEPRGPRFMEIQDAKKMVGALPGASLIPNAVTDAASIADRAIYGDGMGIIKQQPEPARKDWLTGQPIKQTVMSRFDGDGVGKGKAPIRTALLQQYL